MTNIPTDLLRTLVAVNERRSFTKAAQALGISQPAVSTQIKRLQLMLRCEIFDRSTNDLKVTPQGELIISYAHRLLSLNDQIMTIGGSGPRPELMIQVGTSSDFIATRLPNTLARFRERWPDVRFMVRTGVSGVLMNDLRSGALDLFVGHSIKKPHDARRTWTKDMIWVRSLATAIDPSRPVPLVTYGETCIFHQIAVQALKKAGLDWEAVFTCPNMFGLSNAVLAGIGVMPFGRHRAGDLGLLAWEDGPLPVLPNLHLGIHVREGGPQAVYEQLADEIAEGLQPEAKPKPAFVKKRMSAV